VGLNENKPAKTLASQKELPLKAIEKYLKTKYYQEL